MPVIHVEFYAIPRRRAGVTEFPVEADTLRAACRALRERFPRFAATCLDDEDRLKPGCLANVNGRTFTRDPDAPLSEGDRLLILSADVGG